ncbi:hypothetical protein [Mycobacterium heckeshornense]|uniref:hypothetical protein n=1 Tax=Mycobacterium heckeshornense TaxID=110505 RepID=UPI0006628036|nr:hypothetical protein [Mycobacterium heckeshornense]KMV22100.1 hypothetical protein ACT16_13405 [Mycobacterium heckeshornense]
MSAEHHYPGHTDGDVVCEVARANSRDAQQSAQLADMSADRAEICAENAGRAATSAAGAAREATRHLHTIYTLACGIVFGFTLAVLLYLVIYLLVHDLTAPTITGRYDTTRAQAQSAVWGAVTGAKPPEPSHVP